MVRITKPLFSNSASGKLGNLGSFRKTKKGHTFQKRPYTLNAEQEWAYGIVRDRRELIKRLNQEASDKQSVLRATFKAAKAAHSALPKIATKNKAGYSVKRSTPWGPFWRQWLIDHPPQYL